MMFVQILLFIPFTWLDVLDILLVSLLIYQLYNLVKGTVAIRIFIGILSIYLLWKMVEAFQMEMLSEILGQFIGVGVIALLIVFQQELRRFLLLIGNTRFFGKNQSTNLFKKLLGEDGHDDTSIQEIVTACKRMAATSTGALIVVGRTSDASFYSTSIGENIDAKLSARLLESIFYKNSPLHDGAVVIQNNRIKTARTVLPVTEEPDFPAELGMRHRSAVGITESCDAVAITVSEETGKISLAFEGKLERGLSPEKLTEMLTKLLLSEDEEDEKRKQSSPVTQ
jgi:diadenylate cyclase